MSGVIAGIAVSTLGIGFNAAQAGKQNRLRKEAERATEEAMERARDTLKVNYMEGISVPKREAEEARLGLRQTGANLIDAARQGETRGVAAGAQQALNLSQTGERQIAAAQEERLYQLELEKAKEDARLRDMNYQIELGGVMGAQQAQADAVAAQQRAISQAAQGLGQLGGVLLKNEDINPLYARAKGFDLLPNSKTVVDKKAFQNQIQSPTTNTGLFSRQNVNPNFGIDSFQQIQNPLFNPQMDMFATPFDSVTAVS